MDMDPEAIGGFMRPKPCEIKAIFIHVSPYCSFFNRAFPGELAPEIPFHQIL
jgi:hypothetical protein